MAVSLYKREGEKWKIENFYARVDGAFSMEGT